MKMKPYDQVSIIYDNLMNNIDYDSWSKYIISITRENINFNPVILELGAGNCKLANLISSKYKNYLATDISLPMLSTSIDSSVNKICCDMTALPFKNKFDLIFSTFDSINYILKKKSLLKLFLGVSLLLKEKGIFTFDVSLEENSLKFIIDKITEGNFNGIHYKLISKYNKRNRIHSNNFYIWNRAGKKITEIHKEKIYKIDTYFSLAQKAGLYVAECYDCFDFNDVSKKSKRAQFIMRKIN